MSDDMPGSEERWGARRDRRRRFRTVTILVLVGIVSVLAAIVLQFAANGHGVFNHQPSPLMRRAPSAARIGGGIGVLLLIVALAWYNFRSSDELRRQQITEFWAAIGFTMLAMFPILHLLGPYTATETRLGLTYGVGMAGGCIQYIWRLAYVRFGGSNGGDFE